MPAEKLTRTRVVEALNLLGKLASDENLTFELCIYGGSAMMLAYLGKFYPQETLAPKPREMIDGIVRGGP